MNIRKLVAGMAITGSAVLGTAGIATALPTPPAPPTTGDVVGLVAATQQQVKDAFDTNSALVVALVNGQLVSNGQAPADDSAARGAEADAWSQFQAVEAMVFALIP